MLDFEKLIVYKKAKLLYAEIYFEILNPNKVDRILKDQLQRASTSIILNIAEGCSRLGKKDRRHFYVIARGSAFECVSIFEILLLQGTVNNLVYSNLYNKTEEISKMLFGLIRKL